MVNNRFYKKRKSNKKIVIISVIVAVSIALILSALAFSFFKDRSKINYEFDVIFHGEKIEDLHYEDTYVPARIEDKFFDEFFVGNFVIESKTVEWDEGEIIIKDFGELKFLDQVSLLSFYARFNKSREYKRLFTDITNHFKGENNLFVTQITASDFSKSDETILSEQIKFAGALIEGYFQFGAREYLEVAINISELTFPIVEDEEIFPALSKIMLPIPTPTPDFAATPTPRPSLTPTIAPEDIRLLNVVDLSEIDLYALSLLSEIEPGWQDVLERTKQVMIQAKVDGPNPFYRPFFDMETGNYIAYKGDNLVYVMEDQFEIIYSLARVGEINYQVISYLNEKLHNTKIIHSSYAMLTGIPADESESIKGYAYMGLLSRIFEDQNTYEISAQRIEWKVASSQTSPIYGLPFNNCGQECVKVVSNQVIFALVALK